MNRLLRVCSMLVVLGAAPIAGADPPVAAPVLECIDTSLVESVMPEPAQVCCKICHTGKACGDSCIAREKECGQPPGCACDG